MSRKEDRIFRVHEQEDTRDWMVVAIDGYGVRVPTECHYCLTGDNAAKLARFLTQQHCEGLNRCIPCEVSKRIGGGDFCSKHRQEKPKKD